MNITFKNRFELVNGLSYAPSSPNHNFELRENNRKLRREKTKQCNARHDKYIQHFILLLIIKM